MFKSEIVTIWRNRQVYERIDKIDGKYCITIDDGNKIIIAFCVLNSKINKIDSYVWHLRLGRINKDKTKRIHKKGITCRILILKYVNTVYKEYCLENHLLNISIHLNY